MSRLRLGAFAAGLSLLLAGGGLAREIGRFGWSDAAGLGHIERELARRVGERVRALQNQADRVARESAIVASATASRDALPDLFASLSRPLPGNDESISATVWVPAGSAGGYRVLAWSGGPAEDVAPDVLARAPVVAVAPGAAGLRLIYVTPIVQTGRRIGVASAETIVAPNAQPSAFFKSLKSYALASSIGPVPVAQIGREPAGAPGAVRIRLKSPAGAALLDAALNPQQLAAARKVFRWRSAALALLPWAGWLLVSAAASLRRRPSGGSIGPWLSWTAAACALTAVAAYALIALGRAAQVPAAWTQVTASIALLAIVSAGPAGAWWRRLPRGLPSKRPLAWAIENLGGGVVIAAGLIAMAQIWRDRINPTSVENWQLPILASDVTSLAALCSVLLAQVAVSWAVAGTLGLLAARWGITGGRLRDWGGVLLWVIPSLSLPLFHQLPVTLPFPAAIIVTLAAAAFGLLSLPLRRHYRSTSEARRLVFRFVALFAPIVTVYPLAAASADLTTRAIIEGEYGPATMAAQQPSSLLNILSTAQKEVDAIPDLPTLLQRTAPREVPSDVAFTVWAQTVMRRNSVTSELELYGPDKALISRFSLNVPQFGAFDQAGESIWQGAGCRWASFAEVARFGADERRLLHSERGICAPDGSFLGAVVLHVISDYRALPFVSTANPYYGVLGGGETPQAGSSINDLQLVVYGWSLHPLFVSGRVSWPLDAEIDQLLYRSREPFWRDRVAGDRLFHIYFMNDRAGVYALGYPSPTALQHVTRLAEAAAVLMGLFVVYLAAATLTAPLWRGRPTALGRLFSEIRASFYRKLFLFFVLAAVGPVALFAIAFGSYMTAKLRADVESEAASVAIVARRVFDELSAAQARPGQARLAPSDDMMVWIRQMVDQDVNLYDGPQLLATSQRDLFDSGLLPTRTPASVYRDIVLSRRPVSVAEDRIGPFRYLVAAAPAPAPAPGRDAVLTVPLATRQREIEREIDELTRGVLAGTVLLVVFAAALGAAVAARVSDPVARLTRATRQIAAGRLEERLVADTSDELGRLVEDFNSMSDTLVAQRAELARANQLKAWAEMSRQVAHEVKNPLTPIQLAAEHLLRVHEDRGRPLGSVVDRCVTTILKQVRLLRRIASEFSTFATQPVPRFEIVSVPEIVESVLEPYRAGLPDRITLRSQISNELGPVRCDRTQISRALTNLVENALQAMPNGGTLTVTAAPRHGFVVIDVTDTGVGMDAEGVRRAFEPYFSTKTGGSGLGLANAKRSVESCGGEMTIASEPGRGTTVTVSLPAAPPAAPATA